MKTRKYKSYLEILPAAFLSQRHAWQGLASSLPSGACLLVADPNNREMAGVIRTLAQFFREKGRRVVIWTAGLQKAA